MHVAFTLKTANQAPPFGSVREIEAETLDNRPPAAVRPRA
jgi:hypothetical protein